MNKRKMLNNQVEDVDLIEIATGKKINSCTYVAQYQEMKDFYSITYLDGKTGTITKCELISKLKERIYAEGYTIITYKTHLNDYEYSAILFELGQFYYNMSYINQTALAVTNKRNELEAIREMMRIIIEHNLEGI